MTIHIPTKYLWYGGLAVAAGLAYWYLKSNGYWDTWFNAAGNVIPAGPMPNATQSQTGAMIPGSQTEGNLGMVN